MEIQMTTAQRQVLSQRMIQSAEILQMNNQELELFIKKQEMENPLIELEDTQEEDHRKSDLQRKLEWLEATDGQNRVYYREEREEEEEREEWNISVEEEESLADFVLSQLTPLCESERDRDILYFMANSLDSRGYLEESLRTIGERFDLSEAEASHYLYLLQSVEPAGIGARNLRECLLLQLDRMQPSFPMARRIVLECLEMLGRNQIPQIGSCLGLSIEETQENCEIVRQLNPKPGSGFSSRENLRYVQPDVTVIKFQDYFQVLLNDNAYPKIVINSYYSRMLKEDNSEEVQEYIRGKLKQAEWLSHCISQRGTTLLEVTRTIVAFQEAFFERGPGNRRPMRLQDVAEALDIHESTVSRAVRDKYLQCSWGIYPLNYFFAKAVGAASGRPVSTPERIQMQIRAIVEGEDKQHPLSDQKIADRLAAQGFAISRRTVAKYRAEMGLREASGRKEFT